MSNLEFTDHCHGNAHADHQQLLADLEERRFRAQLEEEAYRDAVMCAWIETPARHTEDAAC